MYRQIARGLLLCAFAGLPALVAQVSTGSIDGVIADANGGAVPGAKVVATQELTKQTFEAVTSEAGRYVFPALAVGPYTMTIEKEGFKKLTGSPQKTEFKAR